MSDTSIIYAGFWKRLAAYIIDALIMLVPMFIIGFIVSYFAISSAKTELEMQAFSAGAQLITRIISVIVAWVYFAAMESSSKQGSVGKMVLGIKVTDYNGVKISFGKASGRFFGKILSGIIVGIGFLMIAFTNKKQGLHDIMAGTIIKESKSKNLVDTHNSSTPSKIQVKAISSKITPIKNDSSYSSDTSMKPMTASSISKNGKVDKKIEKEFQENESKFYKQIWKEIEENKTDVGLWAKCFATCEGDENKTKALYVNKKVVALKEELRKQVHDKEREAEEESKKEEASKLLTFEGKYDDIEVFKETLDKKPDFFTTILEKFGYRLIQNENRPEMWSIRFPNGTGAKYVYNLYDLKTEIKKIVLEQKS